MYDFEDPVKFVDLSLDDFPFTIEVFDELTGDLIWSQVVPEPGGLTIPGMGRPSRVKITWANGTVTET